MSFIPTLSELYFAERGPMNERKTRNCYRYSHFQQPGNAQVAFNNARARLSYWHEAFPDTISGNKLAKFLLAKNATGAKLQKLLPAWLKTHIKSVKPPLPRVFVSGLPPQFPAWVKTCNQHKLSFHRSA